MADVSTRETTSLIGSDKVEGTAVYGTDQNKIGTVQRVMIDKLSGKVAYAVISFGGFLGVGEDYYPVPWSTLKYDTNLGGYVTGVTADSLKGAPVILVPRIGNGVATTTGVFTSTTKPNRSGARKTPVRGKTRWSLVEGHAAQRKLGLLRWIVGRCRTRGAVPEFLGELAGLLLS